MMHLYGEIYPKADVDHFYVRRDDGGRGLMSTLDSGRYEKQSMIEYIGNKDREILTTIQHYTGKPIGENMQRFSEIQKERCKEGWQTKVMHGQHVR